MNGTLTLKGVSKNVTLKAIHEGTQTDPWGNEKMGFSLNTVINRKDFGLSWNAPIEAGGVMLGEEVKLNAEIQVVKPK